MSQPLGHRDRADAEADEQDLGRTGARVRPALQSRDEPRHGDVQEPGGGEGQRVGQGPHGLLQGEVGDEGAQDRGNPGGQVQHQRPALGEPGMDQEGEVPDPVRDLVGGDGEGGEQPQRGVLEEGSRDQHPVQGVVDAVPHQYEHARGMAA